MSSIALRCVECGAGPLRPTLDGELCCPICNRIYHRHEAHSIPVLVSSRSDLSVNPVAVRPRTTSAPGRNASRRHWATGKLAQLLDETPGKVLLNFGCGDGRDRAWLEGKGYEVTAFDVFPGPYTDYVCDGHELPFLDSQFDIVTSISVLQYLRSPQQAVAEIYRVLKPGGALVGSSAFLEPQDSRTYFHMTHLGLREILKQAGLEKIEIYPGWPFNESLAMGFWVWNRLPVIGSVTRAVSRINFRVGLGLWKLAFRSKGKDMPEDWPLRFAGSLAFKAVKGMA